MYSFEEAQRDFAQAEKDRPDQVVNRLSSFKAPLSLKKMRQPSFFQKMFSSTKLNRVHSEYFAFPESEVKDVKAYLHEADGEEAKSVKKVKTKKQSDEDLATDEQEKRLREGIDEEKDESSLSIDGKPRNKDQDMSENSEGNEEGSNSDVGYNNFLVDNEPNYPMAPRLGKPVNIDRLVNRTKAAASGIRYLMDMMENDVAQSIQRAKSIPVSKELDRVQVTPEISASAAKVRSTAQVKESVKTNMNEIQRNLNYRKSALIMMNVNYSNQRVCKIDPIYVQEARSIVTYK